MADLQIEAAVEIRVDNLSQLFEPLDPFPFPRKDLAGTTEDFIVGWERELPRGRSIRLVVHVPASEVGENTALQLAEAFSNYFSSRADRFRLELKELFRIGRWSLLIGAAALALCVIAGQYAAQRLGDGYMGRFLSEGAIILGWVANWRSIEIFLYDWWPLALRRNLY